VDGRRRALIIANDEYDHPGLSRLKAPAADAEALANVLGNSEVGGFQVHVVHNAPAHTVGGHIEDLFAESQSDDLVLLHFSGHGLKSDSGELFFAVRNTRPDRLGSTAVPADFVQRCMRSSRARSIVLFLDCCYGGAFGEGVSVRAGGSANVLDSFPAGKLGGGRGRAVITASSAMEYAFEGDSLADEHQQQPSVFTAALVEGLTSGEADRDEDGLVSLNELYDYVYDRVRERNPKQTPGRDVELEGELYLARSNRRRLRPLPVPPDVAAALKSDNVFTRLGAVAELKSRVGSPDLSGAFGAFEALLEVSRSDIRYVQEAASEALGGAAISPDPPELQFGTVALTELPVVKTIRLAGPPLAGAVTVAPSEAWLTASVEPAEVHVSVSTITTGRLSGTLTLTGPTGEVVVPVTAEVVPTRTAPGEAREDNEPHAALDTPIRSVAPPAEAAPTSPLPIEVARAAAPPLAAAPVPADGVGLPLAGDTPGPLTPATQESAQPPAGAERETPSHGPPAASAPTSRQYWKLSGITAVVSGLLMLLCIVLPQQWDTATVDRDPIKATYLLYLGLVAIVVGVLALRARWRIQGLGAVIGASTIGTAVAFDMLNTLDRLGIEGLDVGFWVGLVAPIVLLAAGALAAAGARRESDLAFAALSRSDWASWCVLALALAGALTLLPSALETYSSEPGWGLQGLWVAVLAVWVPLAAVLARPVLLGRWMLIGWSLACVAPVLATWLSWQEYDSTAHGMWFVLLTLAAMVGLAPMVHRDRAQGGGT
jgi:hypothetical protein